ncbi:KipI family sensor histidine kinase inhibitor [Agromyces flavus]|uniref:KipI family sensor histidine kinase inhibitor n=1 Tax=Agromyces flavus TaxID=589382 RepID=A0A1H1LIZ5_9MICO|nr:allophanate hydrolase subunit 1 [Agromyces flavus]MCP2368532.1 KipI family sensor histidine kinase inhibitor [Agromyces flavus]GGI48227.1 allophanate hydrolase [Agromyces flavus]SDR74544.1 sensor histidine kinase inhibitor, KipI family [Agromyces flavus]
MSDVRLLPSGRSALLVECESLDDVLALHDALAVSAPDGVVELVPAARTLLVALDPMRLPLESAASWVRGAVHPQAAAAPPAASGEARPDLAPVVVEVDYRGDDLDGTARLLGVSVEHLVARHVATSWRVAFIGFAPGFGYLVAEDWPFDVPRLEVPRTSVPAGAVGLAGGFSGAYPRASPGGWRLIGRTDAVLWDPHAEPPALLVPGRPVRFREVGA